jgi:hypothetical protein
VKPGKPVVRPESSVKSIRNTSAKRPTKNQMVIVT